MFDENQFVYRYLINSQNVKKEMKYKKYHFEATTDSLYEFGFADNWVIICHAKTVASK